jgi:hypothetical protein
MKKGDLVYLTEEYETNIDGVLKPEYYEYVGDSSIESSDGRMLMIYDFVVGNTFVLEELIITKDEKLRRDRNEKLKELGV